MSRLAPLRRRLALWLCPDLARQPTPAYWPDDPISLPIWAGKVGPDWWQNPALRAYLTQTHRRVKLVEVQAEAVRRFGDLAPSRSALHRYWQRLDALLDGAGTPMQPTPQVTK